MARAPDYNDPKDEAIVQPKVNRDGTITPVLKPNEARGGETRGNMRYVLGLSLAGVIILFIVAYLGFFGTSTVDPSIGPATEATAPASTAPAPATEPAP